MKTLFQTAVEAWRTDGNRYWTVFSFMSATNGVLLAGIYFKTDNGALPRSVAILGIAVCLVWFGIQLRLAHWLIIRNEKVHELERVYIAYENDRKGCEEDVATGRSALIPDSVTIFPDEKFERRKVRYPRMPGFPAVSGGCTMPIIFCVAWLFLGFGGGESLDTGLANHFDEALQLLVGVSVVACLYFGYRLLQTALNAESVDRLRYLPGAVFVIPGIGMLILLCWKLF